MLKLKLMKHKRLIRNTLIAIPLTLVAAGVVYVLTHSGLGVDKANLPKFIQHDFIDVANVYSISKFRSGAGHDFSGGGETCRSMKHYVEPQQTEASQRYQSEHQGIPEPPDGKTDLPIYSPVDGTIGGIGEEHTPIGKQLDIMPAGQPFHIRLFHIWPKAGLHMGQTVKAGEQIGVIGAHQGTDISVQIGQMPWNENFVSYFDVMPDSLFAAYQARGLKSRADVILTKEYRDAHPLQCGDSKQKDGFVWPPGYDADQDYLHLSGYVAPTGRQP
jgi:hypothetical protein